MRRRALQRIAVLLLCGAALALGLLACHGKHGESAASAPALPDIDQMSRDKLLTYLHTQMEMDQPKRQPNEEFREKNRRSFFGCLDHFKNDDCRFMRCSPYAFFAADDFYHAGQWEEAFKYYTGAYDLIKEEVAGTIQSQNKWKVEHDALVKAGQAKEQDHRHYLFRVCTTSQRLYRNHAEIARILFRYALVFDREGKAEEAGNARLQAEEFLKAAADAYAQYFTARKQLTPLLNPRDPQQLSFYIATIKDADQLLPVPRL
jgi:tetratricopeptide (TPR) repeat protein